MGIVTEQQPDRLAERAGEMRHRAVGHDHQIELRNRGGRVGEIVEMRRKIDDRPALRRGFQLLGGRPFLQAVEPDPGQRESLQETREPLRPPVVLPESRAARPHDADLEPIAYGLEQRGEFRRAIGRRRQVRGRSELMRDQA